MNRVRTVGALLLTLFAIACAARSRSVDPAIGTPGQPGVTTADEQTGAVEALPEAGPGSRVTSIAAHASETGTIVTISGTQPFVSEAEKLAETLCWGSTSTRFWRVTVDGEWTASVTVSETFQ